jgi:uncharacterized membrane-anchored protein
MLELIAKANRYMWGFVEFAFVAVLAIMLVYLVLGADSGVFVLSVAGNVIKFTNEVPAGNLVAFVIVGALLYWFVHKNTPSGDTKPSRARRPARSAADPKQIAAPLAD